MKKLSIKATFLLALILISGCNNSEDSSNPSEQMIECPESIEIDAVQGVTSNTEIGCSYVAAMIELEDEPNGVEIPDGDGEDLIRVANTVPAGTYHFNVVVTEILDASNEITVPVTLVVSPP